MSQQLQAIEKQTQGMDHSLHASRKWGLNGFQLKIIALLLMVLDHIHYFLSFTGKVPLFFTQLGRLSAGIFLFLVVEGFVHTHDRRKYFLRMYGMGAMMGLVKFGLTMFGMAYEGALPMVPQNGIFFSFALILILLQGVDWLQKKQWVKGFCALLLPVAYTFVLPLVLGNAGYTAYFLVSAVFPSVMVSEGGPGFIISGVLLYLFRNHRKLQAAVYAVFTIGWCLFMSLMMGMEINLQFLINENFEWMSAFSAIFMLLYNGERGRSSKKLFYIFYPAHVYILFAICCIIFHVLY